MDMTKLDIDRALLTATRRNSAGELPQAKALCQEILLHHPDNADALHLLGVITAKMGQPLPAINFIRRAIIQRPDWPQAHYHLGNVLQMAGQLEKAIASYRRGIALNPDYLMAYNNLGVALKESGQQDEAIAAFEKALAIDPADPIALANLANIFNQKGELNRSLHAYRRAISLKPDSPEAWNNFGAILKEFGMLDESLSACRKAIHLRADFAHAHNNLGATLEETGQLDEAILSFSRAIALNPNFSQAYYNLGNVLKSKGQVQQSIAAYRQAVAINPSFVEAHNNLVYALHFHPDYDARAIAEQLHLWNRQHSTPLKKFFQPHINDRNPNRRLRIGYLSPDFKEHPVGRFLLPLLAHHNKNQFEIFAYAHVPISDGVTHKLRSYTDIWRDITGLTDSRVADLIRADQIDILIDLTMHMARNRLLVFARKPAPVQITWLAYCSSTGLDAIDYRLSDNHLDPPGANDSVYTEKTIRLPETYWCYQPTCSALNRPSTSPAQTAGHITFGCLSNFAKVSQPTIAAWTRILQASPGSHLLLHSPAGSHRQLLLDRVQKDGIDPCRVRFVGKLPLRQYLQLYNQIDIALDTFPYSGGTTTCDALWMGVPVVSLVGKTAVGRGGLSILSKLELPELVARSQEEYVQIAAKLANDLPRLNNLRCSLPQRMKCSPLMDAQRFAQQIESAFRQTWLHWCQTQ